MNIIEQLKDAEKAYQLSLGYFHGEKFTTDEYMENIVKYGTNSEYLDCEPDEMVVKICELIKNL